MNFSTKKCNKCDNTKPLDSFHKRKSSTDGYEYCCKECKKHMINNIKLIMLN